MINTLLVNSFLTTTFTEIGEAVAERDFSKVHRRLKKSSNDMINLVIPLTFWVILMADPLIRILFQRGSFDSVSTDLVSSSLIGYSIMILTAPIGGLINNALVALKDVKFLNALAVGTIGLNVFFDWAFLAPFGHAGIAGSTAAVSVISAVISYVWLKRKHSLAFINWGGFFAKLFVGISLFVFFLLLKKPLGERITWILLVNVFFFLFFVWLNRSMMQALWRKLKSWFGTRP